MRNRLHNLLKQGLSSLPTFKWSAISSWITQSTYLDVVRGNCSALESMLKICVVLYHGWQIHVTKTDVLVSLDPGFNGMARLSSDNLTTQTQCYTCLASSYTRHSIQEHWNSLSNTHTCTYTKTIIMEAIAVSAKSQSEQRGWPLRNLWRPRTHSYPFPSATKKKKKKLPPG
jgi:hypothetical protein